VTEPEGVGGLEKLELWKVQSELRAETAPDDARIHYETARRLANSWLDRKKSEAIALGTITFGKLDLSERTLSPTLKTSVASFETASAGGGVRDPGTAALVVAGVIRDLIKESRQANATAIAEQLEKLKWQSWEEIRS